METGIFASHWTDFRAMRGRSPLHRQEMDDLLKTFPTILYFGDSWFSTPLYPNLARQSIDHVKGMGMLAGKPGASSKDLLGRSGNVKRLVERIEYYKFDALVMSLGGNDAIEKLEKISQILVGETSPDHAFQMIVNTRVFEHILQRYRRLLSLLSASDKLPDNFRVLIHGYVPLVRLGEPANLNPSNLGMIGMLITSTGPWLWGPMKSILRDKDSAKRFSELLLIDGFKEMVLEPLKAEYPRNVKIVDFTSLDELKSYRYWFDEIHPNRDGFRIMACHLNKSLESTLPAQKRHAVLVNF